MNKKKGQISTEYLIVVGFVTFIILIILGIAMFYTSQIQDSIKFTQLEKSARKMVFAAETTFYDGEPSKTTIEVYFPIGITSISILPNDIVFEVSSISGKNTIAYHSSVPLEGSLSPVSGLKKVHISAQNNKIIISEN